MTHSPLDPEAIKQLAGVAAKPLLEKGMGKVVNRIEKAESTASESFKILGQETSIYCPESIQTYSAALEAKPQGLFGTKARFQQGPVRRASIRPLIGMQTSNAISILEDGYEIDLKKLRPGETYILDAEYKIEDPRFVESLVNREVQRETTTTESTEYWMVAQLKFVDVLRNKKYGRIDLKDIDFNVDVAVHQDVNAKIPSIFKEQLETLVKLAGPLGRDEVFNTIRRMQALKSRQYGADSVELLGELVELFTSQSFKKYVEVKQDFEYYGCEKGTNVYDLPWGVWPKFMTVTSRTDLGLDREAAKGTLVYKRKDFTKALEDIFGEQSKVTRA